MMHGDHWYTFIDLLKKQKFIARWFVITIKPASGLDLNEILNSVHLSISGQRTSCCSFLPMGKRLILQIFLWVLLKCAPPVCQGCFVLNFPCEWRAEYSLLRQQCFPIYTQGKLSPPSTGLEKSWLECFRNRPGLYFYKNKWNLDISCLGIALMF